MKGLQARRKQQMISRLSSALMLTLALSMLTAPAAASSMVGDPNHSSPYCHEDGSPCPDNGGDVPCDGDCPCLCCFGHRTVPVLPATIFALIGQPVSIYRFLSRDAAHPMGVTFSIFRPPRA
jgi:hypothetical protein